MSLRQQLMSFRHRRIGWRDWRGGFYLTGGFRQDSPRYYRAFATRASGGCAAARELRDRWLEQVNAEPIALPCGKYDVGRAIASTRPRLMEIEPSALLDAA